MRAAPWAGRLGNRASPHAGRDNVTRPTRVIPDQTATADHPMPASTSKRVVTQCDGRAVTEPRSCAEGVLPAARYARPRSSATGHRGVPNAESRRAAERRAGAEERRTFGIGVRQATASLVCPGRDYPDPCSNSRSTRRAIDPEMRPMSDGDMRCRYHSVRARRGNGDDRSITGDAVECEAREALGGDRLLLQQREIFAAPSLAPSRSERSSSAGMRSRIGVSTAPGHRTLTRTP